ncbi:MAG: hypothetical protein WC985_11005, partial [Thermoplasmata archaeon]
RSGEDRDGGRRGPPGPRAGHAWEEAYMLASLVCDLRISQDVDPYRTCKLVIPKTYLHRLHGMAVTGLSRRHPRTARRRS